MIRLIIPTLLLIVGSAALSADTAQDAKDQAALAKALDGLTPDKPSDCVDTFQLRDASTARFGNTILYEVSRGDIYRNDTSGGCFGLSRNDAIVTSTPTSQFCRGDIVHTVDLVSHTPSGSCIFGDFTQYRRARAPR